jgi:hypothetical protein
MVANWALETASIFLTMCGALLIFVAHQRLQARLFAVSKDLPEIVISHHKQLSAGLAVISASLVVQCAALVYL